MQNKCFWVTPTQVLSCEYCEVFKNSLFYRILLAAASDISHFNPLVSVMTCIIYTICTMYAVHEILKNKQTKCTE